MNRKSALQVLLILSVFFLYNSAWPQENPARDWRPSELIKMESEFQELRNQVDTLDSYTPEKFPDFKQLEKINQLVEQLDFNNRKFDLMIKQYNILEDRFFPFLQEFYKKNPELKNQILQKLTEYSGNSRNSFLLLQEQINSLALMNERLQKRIEFIQVNTRDKVIEEGDKDKKSIVKNTNDISAQLDWLEQELQSLKVKLTAEEVKFKELKEKEQKQTEKIVEKQNQITEYKKKIGTTRDEIYRLIYKTFASAREIRLNGLEIPKLNTTKTFIYLSDTTIKTYKVQIDNTKKEIQSLEKLERKALLTMLKKGLIYVFIAIMISILFIKASRLLCRRVIRKVEQSQSIPVNRKQRYHTMSEVLMSFIKVLVWVMSGLTVLNALEINIGPILVAAGGLSLAIGFGAQSLIRDIVSGFFILLEEQFAIGDVVDINGEVGTVERISLRTVRMRALDGSLHIIQNGAINKVSNKTFEWSRAVVNVKTSVNAKPEKVITLLAAICQEIYNDPMWKPSLVSEPVPEGIVSMTEFAAEYRILATTVPGQQWAVGREIHIRIRKAFSQEGIESPIQFVNLVGESTGVLQKNQIQNQENIEK